MARFADRHDAGKRLAQRLVVHQGQPHVIIFALPRGGVPVAYEVALALNAPLDVFIVRKLGMPGHEELAIGAIASGGIQILNVSMVQALRLDQSVISAVIQRESVELRRREEQYRGSLPHAELQDRTVILIDDGLATGASMLAAIRGLRSRHPHMIIVAVPVATPQALHAIQPEADEIACILSPDPFEGVGKWYRDFSQTTDEEVRRLLHEANELFHQG